MTDWYSWLKDNLRPDQLERIDAYDVEILSSVMKRLILLKKQEKHRYVHPSRKHIAVNSIWMDVHGEMGGITEAQIYERLKKLGDMALIRVGVVFNRDMPEDLGVTG